MILLDQKRKLEEGGEDFKEKEESQTDEEEFTHVRESDQRKKLEQIVLSL